MLNPDFSQYSLALIKDDKIIFSSDKSGLRPLIECIKKSKGKEANCILFDKVIGLAAARCIIYSGFISNVIAGTASEKAIESLEKNSIKVKAATIVKNICNKDRTGICPMEKKALEAADNATFYNELAAIFY